MRAVSIENRPVGVWRSLSVRSRWVAGVLFVLSSGLSSGCAANWSYRAMIQSADVNERVRGAWAAGEARDRTAVPLLVDRLEDEDEAVRFVAILALDKITGERLGYDYAQPVTERNEAVERWRTFARQGAGRSGSASSVEGVTPKASTTGGE